MPADTDSVPKSRLGPFRIIFLAAFLLSVATYLLGYLFVFLVSPLASSGLLGATNAFAILSLLQGGTVFVFNPIICFLVFYRIGTFSRVVGAVGYLGFLTYAFSGAALGYAASYLVLLEIQATNAGYSILGPNTDWLVLLANFTLGTARGAVDMALTAFAGVMVSRLRSGPPAPTSVVIEPTIPALAEENPT